MTVVSIRVSRETYARLRHLAVTQKRSIRSVVDEAVREYEKEQRWRAAEAAMARLQSDHDAWSDYQNDAVAWDSTLRDGLEDLSYRFD